MEKSPVRGLVKRKQHRRSRAAAMYTHGVSNTKMVKNPTPEEIYIQDFLKGSVTQNHAEMFLDDLGYKPSPHTPQVLQPNTYILGVNQDWNVTYVMLGEYKSGN